MPPTIAETVRFTLAPGADTAEFANASQTVNRWLTMQPGWLSRTLSCAADGLWQDHVIWADMASAAAAASAMPREATLQPFLAMIDPASIDMRHADILSQA